MAELWAWARSRARRRAPVRAASRRAPSSTAMPVRVTLRSQDRQPNASKASHDGSAQNVKFYNPLGGLQANIREAWSKEEEVEKGIKNLTYIERLKERVKKVKIPELRSAPHGSPDLVPERKRTMPMNPAKFFRRLFRTVSQRPIRERVIHLLALKNYKKSELLACLEREGVVEKDKESLGKILQEVANLDANENSFSLKEHFFKDIQLDWPGYSERDRKTLEVTLFQKTAPSQNATSTSQSLSLGPSERDTPLRTAQKWPLASAFVNPVMTKKQRIDQEPSDVQPAASGCSSSSLDLPSTSCSTLNLSPSVSSISTSTCELQQKDKIRTLSGIPAPVRVQGKTPESKGEKAEVRGAQQNNSGPVPEKKKVMHVRLADIDWSGCAAVYGRPYKDRVIHLLALRDYKEPELLARLQRDGVRQKDKDSLGKILEQVANLNAKDNSYSLKEHLFQTLQTDWPGYSKTDRKNLKLILSRKSASSQNATTTTQATSLGPSARDAPARPAQKRPLASDFTSPVMSKKRRIGHQHSHVQLAAGGHFSSFLLPSTSLFTSDMSPSVGSISPCTRVVQETEKFQSSSTPVPARVQKEIPNSNKKKNELGRLKQLHPLDFDEGNRKDTSIASTSSATSNQPDYLRKNVKNVAIVSLEQRQRYKDDFNAEYEEYRNLHSQIDKTIKKFRRFQEQLKSLTPGSKAYQVKKDKTMKTVLHHSSVLDSLELLSETKRNCQTGIYAQTLLGLGLIFARPCPKTPVGDVYEEKMLHHRILADYQQLQQGSPSFSEMKSRCQYLHKKLSHIQSCISEFDQQLVESWHQTSASARKHR